MDKKQEEGAAIGLAIGAGFGLLIGTMTGTYASYKRVWMLCATLP